MNSKPEKITIPKLLRLKQMRQPITMLTAYDYPTALMLEQAGVDILLVGDRKSVV